jgi:cytochrome c biogenesis protein CcmG, thiol:disulfide interchange protein DsbE
VVAAVVVLAITRGGSGTPKSAAPSDAAAQKALAGSPPALASLHDQGSELLGGGNGAFQKRLTALRGHPVVVNKWASWCGPCRFEFPFFQRQVSKRGKRVAFLGVDGEDSKDGAKRFLAKFPVPYPSFFDPHSDIAKVFHGDRAFPTTVYYDRRGGVEYVKQGGYASEAALAQDIDRYAR